MSYTDTIMDSHNLSAQKVWLHVYVLNVVYVYGYIYIFEMCVRIAALVRTYVYLIIRVYRSTNEEATTIVMIKIHIAIVTAI